jgi:ketosteroid isomerase-like protein
VHLESRFAAICCIAFFCATAAAAETPEQAVRAIVDGERRFYEMGQEQGTRAAFLEFLADNSIVFEPGPVDGKKAWAARPEGGLWLKWQPVFAAMSRSADLGYTTGPAEFRKNKEDEKPFGHGQYISIWRKQKDGAWKVALDVGHGNPRPPNPPGEPELSFPAAGADVHTDIAVAKRKLGDAKKKFAATAANDSTAAIAEAARDDIRVHREEMFPGLGKDAVRLMLSVRRGKLTLTQMGEAMSAAGDLAYTYGRYVLARSQNDERGHYLQIWRAENDGTWKLALDFQAPVPPEQKKPGS